MEHGKNKSVSPNEKSNITYPCLPCANKSNANDINDQRSQYIQQMLPPRRHLQQERPNQVLENKRELSKQYN